MTIATLSTSQQEKLHQIFSRDEATELAAFIQEQHLGLNTYFDLQINNNRCSLNLLGLSYLAHDASRCAAWLLEQQADPIIVGESEDNIIHIITNDLIHGKVATCWFDLFKKFPRLLQCRNNSDETPLDLAIRAENLFVTQLIVCSYLSALYGNISQIDCYTFHNTFLAILECQNRKFSAEILEFIVQLWQNEPEPFDQGEHNNTLFSRSDRIIIKANFRMLFSQEIGNSLFLEFAIDLGIPNLSAAFLEIATTHIDAEGNTPLHYLATTYQTNSQCLSMLMTSIDISTKNIFNETAFVKAAAIGNFAFIETFLQIAVQKLKEYKLSEEQIKNALGYYATRGTVYQAAMYNGQFAFAEQILNLAKEKYLNTTFIITALLPAEMSRSYSEPCLPHMVPDYQYQGIKSKSSPAGISTTGYFGINKARIESETDPDLDLKPEPKSTKKSKSKCIIL